MLSYCRVVAEHFLREFLKHAGNAKFMGFVVAEAGFEPATFGNRVSEPSTTVSNINIIPILWELQLQNTSKEVHSLIQEYQSKLYKNFAFTAELLPSKNLQNNYKQKSFFSKTKIKHTILLIQNIMEKQ